MVFSLEFKLLLVRDFIFYLNMVDMLLNIIHVKGPYIKCVGGGWVFFCGSHEIFHA